MNELTDRDESGLGWVYSPQPQQTFIEEVVGIISGLTELVEAQDYIDVVFGSTQPTADWVMIEASIFNTTDVAPLNVWPGVVTSKTTAGFRLQLNGTPDSGNYFLNWSIRGVFGYYLSGPFSGRRNVASTPFTVRLPDESTLAGTVIITPSDGGVGGTFTPATVALTVAAPSATFTYTPSSYGPRSIGTDNDRGLVDPAEIGFTSIASEYTLDGPTDGYVGEASTDFTVALPVGGALLGSVTITPDDGGDGGIFAPTSVVLSTATPSATFTYTAASIGDKIISTTNTGGLNDPNSLTYGVTFNLLNSLISYWTLDEASGTRVDSHGTNDLTDVNTVGSTTGIINNGANFVAVNTEYLKCLSNASLEMSGNTDWTISCWVKLSSLPLAFNQWGLVTKDTNAPANSRDYTLEYHATNPDGFRIYIQGGAFAASTGVAATTGIWYFLVAWYDSSNGQLHLRIDDTTTYNSTTGATGTDVSPAEFRIGARQYAGDEAYADAVIDEVGLWKRVLRSEEITMLYNGGAGLPYSSF